MGRCTSKSRALIDSEGTCFGIALLIGDEELPRLGNLS